MLSIRNIRYIIAIIIIIHLSHCKKNISKIVSRDIPRNKSNKTIKIFSHVIYKNLTVPNPA